MATAAPTDGERVAYYGGALLALRFFEGRRATGRRFGPDADARWADFKGELSPADRIDLLIRDADLEWSGALGARRAFDLDGVEGDEAFGPAWESLPSQVASDLWQAHAAGPIETLRALLDALFVQHRQTLSPIDIASVAPTHQLLIAGPSAIASALLAFEGRTDLDFGQQVVIVASSLLPRQLGALAPALLATGGSTRFAIDAPTTPFSVRYLSPDASDADRAHYERLSPGHERG